MECATPWEREVRPGCAGDLQSLLVAAVAAREKGKAAISVGGSLAVKQGVHGGEGARLQAWVLRPAREKERLCWWRSGHGEYGAVVLTAGRGGGRFRFLV